MGAWYKCYGPALLDDERYNGLTTQEMAALWHIWNSASARPEPGKFASKSLLTRLLGQRFPGVDWKDTLNRFVSMGFLQIDGNAVLVAAFVDMSAPGRRHDPTAADRQKRWRDAQRYVTLRNVTALDSHDTHAGEPGGPGVSSALLYSYGEYDAAPRDNVTRSVTSDEPVEWDIRDTLYDLTKARPWGTPMGKKALELESEFGFAVADAAMRKLKAGEPGLSAWELIKTTGAALAKEKELEKERQEVAARRARQQRMAEFARPDDPTPEQVAEGVKAWEMLRSELPRR